MLAAGQGVMHFASFRLAGVTYCYCRRNADSETESLCAFVHSALEGGDSVYTSSIIISIHCDSQDLYIVDGRWWN